MVTTVISVIMLSLIDREIYGELTAISLHFTAGKVASLTTEDIALWKLTGMKRFFLVHKTGNLDHYLRCTERRSGPAPGQRGRLLR